MSSEEGPCVLGYVLCIRDFVKYFIIREIWPRVTRRITQKVLNAKVNKSRLNKDGTRHFDIHWDLRKNHRREEALNYSDKLDSLKSLVNIITRFSVCKTSPILRTCFRSFNSFDRDISETDHGYNKWLHFLDQLIIVFRSQILNIRIQRTYTFIRVFTFTTGILIERY